jgi:hypothetical protein
MKIYIAYLELVVTELKFQKHINLNILRICPVFYWLFVIILILSLFCLPQAVLTNKLKIKKTLVPGMVTHTSNCNYLRGRHEKIMV